MTINVGVHLDDYLILISDRRCMVGDEIYTDNEQKMVLITNGFMTSCGWADVTTAFSRQVSSRILDTPEKIGRTIKWFRSIAPTLRRATPEWIQELNDSGFLIGVKTRGGTDLRLFQLEGAAEKGIYLGDVPPWGSAFHRPACMSDEQGAQLDDQLQAFVVHYRAENEAGRASPLRAANRLVALVRENLRDSTTASMELDVGIVSRSGPTWQAFLDKSTREADFKEL